MTLSGAFLFLLLGCAYLGLTSIQIPTINDKVLHFLAFFILTVCSSLTTVVVADFYRILQADDRLTISASQLCFYWIIDGSRRRTLNFTLIGVTFLLGVGSEVVQSLVPNGRVFDPYDILANVVGSLSALALCSWYHKRMLERRRLSKYHIVPGSDDLGQDVELGDAGGSRQDVGVSMSAGRSLEEQVDNWDEHADDPWDEDVAPEEEGRGTESGSRGGLTPSSGSAGDERVQGTK